MEMTVPSQGHRKPIAGQYPSPLRSRAGAPGGDRETAASGRRGSETSPVSSGVLSRLTWAAERPGGSEAAEATNCPGGHHLVQKMQGKANRPAGVSSALGGNSIRLHQKGASSDQKFGPDTPPPRTIPTPPTPTIPD